MVPVRRTLLAIFCGAAATLLIRFSPAGSHAAMLAVVVLGAIALSTLGRSVPGFGRVGGDTLTTLLVPSWLAYAGFVRAPDVEAVARMFERTDALEVFMTLVIAGGILSVERRTLWTAVAMILPILALTSAAILAGGLAAGVLLGQSLPEVLFLTLLPMMSGGLAAGLVPLSIGYTDAFDMTTPQVMARILPPLLFSNIATILAAGWMAHGTGAARRAVTPPVPGTAAEGRDAGEILTGLAAIAAIYGLARAVAAMAGMTVPLVVILLAVAIELTGVLPARMRRGVDAVYRLGVAYLTLPLIFAVGLVFMPWNQLVAGFDPVRLMTIAAALLVLGAAVRAVAQRLGQDPVEAILLASARVAMGGAGSIAILNAAGRMDLMAQAQIIVRIGGIATVSLALLLV